MKRRILVYVVAAAAVLCACSKSSTESQEEAQSPADSQEEAQSPADSQGEAQAPADAQEVPDVATDTAVDAKSGVDAGNEEADSTVALKETKLATPCKDGGVYQDDSCRCGEMTNTPDVASQWVCFGDYLRCFQPQGCTLQDVTYPTLTKIHTDGAYCGQDRIPENRDGFVCTGDVKLQSYLLTADFETLGAETKLGLWRFTGQMSGPLLDLTPKREYWQCAQAECDCHGVKITKSDICMDTKALARFASGNSTDDIDSYYPPPSVPSFIDWKDDECKGMIYPAKGERFDYDCNGGRWVCLGKDCECPEKLEDDALKYKTIHLGDICDVKPIYRALKLEAPKNKSKHGTKCKNGKCLCNSSIYNESLESIRNNPKCYCDNTYIGPAEWTETCLHDESLTIYCQKDAVDFSNYFVNDAKYDSTTEVYTIELSEVVLEDYEKCNYENNNEKEESTPKKKDHYYIGDDIRFWYDDKYKICIDYSGCACADSICPMSTVCVEGKCIDPITGNEVKYGDFISTVQCMDEETCGCPTPCGNKEWCVAGKCYSELFSVIYRDNHQDKRLLYNPFGILYRAKYGYADYGRMVVDPSDVAYSWEDWGERYKSPELDNFTFWLSTNMSEENGYAYTDQLAYAERCCDGSYSYTKSQPRCMRATGCPCGSSTCGMGGLCKDGKCLYDSHYLNMMCYPGHESYEDFKANEFEASDSEFDGDRPANEAIRLDEAGNCLCNGTMLAPELLNNHRDQYVCDDYGWVCTDKKGCACGDATCDYKALCVKPGQCTVPLEKYQGIAWTAGSREPLECASGLLDFYDECCDSGVLDKHNHCCTSGVLSKSGFCCPSQSVNDAGQCTCKTDVSRACCESSVLDKADHCCNSAVFDKDGKCCNGAVFDKDGKCCPEYAIKESTGECECDHHVNGNCFSHNVSEPCEYGDGEEKKQGELDKHGNCCQGELDSGGNCCQGVWVEGEHHFPDCCESGVITRIKHNNRGIRCCESGKVDEKYGSCCDSGVLDKDGRCCRSGALNKDGKCCRFGVEDGVCTCESGSQPVSVQCCPKEFVDNSDDEKKCTCLAVDRFGECCSSGVLSESGFCCPDDDVNKKTGTCRHSIDRFGDKHPLNSVFTNSGYFCESGILVENGENCCKNQHVKDGRCLCSMYSDSDGECCESGVKEKYGDCCPTGVLSENGYCCPERHIGSHGQCLCLIDPETRRCAEAFGNDGAGCASGTKDKFGNCCYDKTLINGFCRDFDEYGVRYTYVD